MAAGLQVFNDSGSFQIDDRNKNMLLIAKGTGTFVQGSNPAQIPDATVTVQTEALDAVILIRETSAPVAVLGRYRQGANWVFGLACASTISFQWFVFATERPGAEGNFGLRVYAEDGTLAFNSDVPFLRLKSLFQTSQATQTFAVPQDGRTYAAALSFSRAGVAQLNESFSLQLRDFLHLTATSLLLSQAQVYRFPRQGSTPIVWTSPPQILLVDVTNY